MIMKMTMVSMVDDKKLLMSLLFSNSTINGKKVEISYHKAFKMVSTRVMQMLGEKIDEKNTFEPPKEPVDKPPHQKSLVWG